MVEKEKSKKNFSDPIGNFFKNSLALLCLYFICTCFFVFIVLQFPFCLYIQHITQTSIQPAGFFCSLYVLYLYFFFLTSWLLPFVRTVQHTQTQTSMRPAGFKPATPASDRPQTLSLDRPATGIGRIEPATFQLVAQCLNRLRHHLPHTQ